MSYSISNSEQFLLHLCRLLEARSDTDFLALECLEAVRHSEVLLHPGGEVPTFHTLQIYRTRALLHGSSRNGAVGYDRLLPALEREQEQVVRLLSIATCDGVYLLFTCAGARRLIGLLKSRHLLDDFLCAIDSCPGTRAVVAPPVLADPEPV